MPLCHAVFSEYISSPYAVFDTGIVSPKHDPPLLFKNLSSTAGQKLQLMLDMMIIKRQPIITIICTAQVKREL